MQIELIKAPTVRFLEMLYNHLRPADRKQLEGIKWGAVGLVQGRLIDLYWASDVAEKASQVSVTLVIGNCPQHVQMLAVLGKQAAVKQALDKIGERCGRHGQAGLRGQGRSAEGALRLPYRRNLSRNS